MERIVAISKQHERVNPRHGKTGRGICGDCHVNGLMERRRIGKCGKWMDVDRLPATSLKPTGVFIHELAITTKMAEAIPLSATRIPAARWARGETRCPS